MRDFFYLLVFARLLRELVSIIALRVGSLAGPCRGRPLLLVWGVAPGLRGSAVPPRSIACPVLQRDAAGMHWPESHLCGWVNEIGLRLFEAQTIRDIYFCHNEST